MADADDSMVKQREKAEKLVAARKRFEELKRKKQPGKKNEKPLLSEAEKPARDETGDGGHTGPTHDTNMSVLAAENTAVGSSTKSNDSAHQEGEHNPSAAADVSSRSKDPTSDSEPLARQPPSPLSTAVDAKLSQSSTEIYQRQALLIRELQAEKSRLQLELTSLTSTTQKYEALMVERDKALEELSSVSAELVAEREQANVQQELYSNMCHEMETLKKENLALVRQASNLSSQISQKDRTIAGFRRNSLSGSQPRAEDLLKSKEDQIESMSVELSKLKSDLQASEQITTKQAAEVLNLQSIIASLEETAISHDKSLNLKSVPTVTQSSVPPVAPELSFNCHEHQENLAEMNKYKQENIDLHARLLSLKNENEILRGGLVRTRDHAKLRKNITTDDNNGEESHIRTAIIPDILGVHNIDPGRFSDVDLEQITKSRSSHMSSFSALSLTPAIRIEAESTAMQLHLNEVRQGLKGWKDYKIDLTALGETMLQVDPDVFHI